MKGLTTLIVILLLSTGVIWLGAKLGDKWFAATQKTAPEQWKKGLTVSEKEGILHLKIDSVEFSDAFTEHWVEGDTLFFNLSGGGQIQFRQYSTQYGYGKMTEYYPPGPGPGIGLNEYLSKNGETFSNPFKIER